MKRLIICYLLLHVLSFAMAQNASFRMQLLGQWNDTSLASQINQFSQDQQIWNDLIGWTNPKDGKEYVIMGSIDSTYFFDISNPSSIVKCAVYPGRARSVNRDYDVYKHYVYCVSDNGPPGVLQIIDLQYLPDSIHVVSEDSTICSRTHSLVVDSNSKRLYFHAGSKYGLEPNTILRYDQLVLSIEDPEHPIVIGELSHPACGRVHEAYYRNDTAYCSCEYRGLHVFDMRNPDSMVYLGGISPPYPYNGYNHTSWVDPSGKFIVFNDEVPVGLPMKVYSMNLSNGSFDFETLFNSHPGATPHNMIWNDNLLYTSAYEDGIVIWNMNNPYNPVITGYYDTYPQNPEGSYKGLTGCWGVYPFFKSGIIAASDMRNGLFLLKYDQTLGVNDQQETQPAISIYPNPFTTQTSVRIKSSFKQKASLVISSSGGQILLNKHFDLFEGENDLKLEEVSGWSEGIYLLKILTENDSIHHRLVKQ